MTTDNAIPYGSDASAGTYTCNDCGERIQTQSTSSLPPCPNSQSKPHSQNSWRALSGAGDAAGDPQR